MKMTMHIDEIVLAQVMELTGAKTKTQAVEIALREMARRHQMRKLFRESFGLSPEQWDAEAAPKASDQFDAPDIDHDKVKAFISTMDERRRFRELMVAEDRPIDKPRKE
jgi:Arc/MetJ family transcription regulator